jgi:hypothetical protein
MSAENDESGLRNIQLINFLNQNHNMSDEEDLQDFQNQNSDGLEQEVDQDEDMDVGLSSKHRSSRGVDEQEDEEEDDDEDEEDEDEAPGRRGKKRAKVIFFQQYVNLHFIAIHSTAINALA